MLLRSDADPAQAVAAALSRLQGTAALLEFLTVLPDEWGRESLKIAPEARAQGMGALRCSTAALVFPSLFEEYAAAGQQHELRRDIFACITVLVPVLLCKVSLE